MSLRSLAIQRFFVPTLAPVSLALALLFLASCAQPLGKAGIPDDLMPVTPDDQANANDWHSDADVAVTAPEDADWATATDALVKLQAECCVDSAASDIELADVTLQDALASAQDSADLDALDGAISVDAPDDLDAASKSLDLADLATLPDGLSATADAQVAEVSASPSNADVAETAVDTNEPPEIEEVPWYPPLGITTSPPIYCTPGAPPAGVFQEVAQTVGVTFDRPYLWPADSAYPNQHVHEGGGQAVADFNGDGRLDIYMVIATGDDKLYLADPKQAIGFVEFSIATTATEETSVIAADFDGDGDQDLIIGADGMIALRNDGPSNATGVAWTDVTAVAGLIETKGFPLFNAAVGDVDRDGWLDILIASNKFEKPPPMKSNFPPTPFACRLLRGKGNWQFEDVSSTLIVPKFGPSYISSLFDYDNDGDLDVYITYDFGELFLPNQLLRNDTAGPGQPIVFKNVSPLSGADMISHSMGAAIADYDRDGRLDVFFTGQADGNHFLHNETLPGGPPNFNDIGIETGTNFNGNNVASWGAQFIDVSNDGMLDLYVVNGYLDGQLNTGGKCPAGSCPNPLDLYEKDQLFEQNDNGTYSEITDQAGIAGVQAKRSVVRADFNQDGFIDLLLGSVSGKSQLYLNGCNNNAWLHVTLKGKGGNQTGLGARITMQVGPVQHLHEMESGSTGLWGSSEQAALFGLGNAKKVDTLTVRWPSGINQTFKGLPVRRRIVITEP